MRRRNDNDSVLLNAFRFYRDDLINLETFCKILENLKENHKQRQRDLFDIEEEKVKLQEETKKQGGEK